MENGHTHTEDVEQVGCGEGRRSQEIKTYESTVEVDLYYNSKIGSERIYLK